ncbi:serine/threonine-protein kinase fray2-like isoform X1 [Diachasmimorpha longicaudata]|uniref:serine/threonine-protein kinase fray2-like isoform X1 n=1 Tax=Diachasmimorpha longicaudata TaxID=58733 RepID=UPI0030B88464
MSDLERDRDRKHRRNSGSSRNRTRSRTPVRRSRRDRSRSEFGSSQDRRGRSRSKNHKPHSRRPRSHSREHGHRSGQQKSPPIHHRPRSNRDDLGSRGTDSRVIRGLSPSSGDSLISSLQMKTSGTVGSTEGGIKASGSDVTGFIARSTMRSVWPNVGEIFPRVIRGFRGNEQRRSCAGNHRVGGWKYERHWIVATQV